MKKQALLFLGYFVLVSFNTICIPTGFADPMAKCRVVESRKNPCKHITQRIGQGAAVVGKGIVGLGLACATGSLLRDFIYWTMPTQED